MTSVLQFLPLFFWAAFAFAALYTMLETEFRPLHVLVASFVAAARILATHWRIAAALFAVFASAPIVEALAIVGLKLRGQPAALGGLAWQTITAAAIAWIATYIHGLALPLPVRTPAASLRYRAISVAAGVCVFLVTVLFSLGSSLALLTLGLPPRYRADFAARVIQSLLFVPLALARPALSLGSPSPVRAAFAAAARKPLSLGVWVIALGLPALAFEWIGADIVRAHFSLLSVLTFRAAKVVFNVFDCAFFEAATLLLLARARRRVRSDEDDPAPGTTQVALSTLENARL
jgi:hypothetical protein